MSFSLSNSGWVSIWSVEPAMLTNYAWASKIWPGRPQCLLCFGRMEGRLQPTLVVQASCLEVLLVSRINQATKPLFSTEFSCWAILILLLFISLINIKASVFADAVSPSNFPGSTGAGPWHFSMSQLFAWGGQSTGVSALASFLPKKTKDWSPLEWTGWISWQSMGLSRVFSNTTVQKHQFFGAQLYSQSNSHIHTWLLEKP